MKKVILVIIGILIISGFAASGTTNTVDIKTTLNENDGNLYSVDDLSTITCLSMVYPQVNELKKENLDIQYPVLGRDYPIGTTIWQYYITGGSDNSPKAIAPIEDINGDGIDDVIVCSEDNNIRCFSGGETGSGVVIWTHNIYSGNIYSQNGLTIMPDVNGDGYQEVVVGATGGARLVRCISGLTGTTVWTYDTHEYGGGGWVYQVDSSFDYNNDGKFDVLATAGDDSSDTGPKRAFLLNGVTGAKIWDYYLGGPGFSIIGVEDFTGDGIPDVVDGCSNEGETIGYVKGINGANGAQVWSFTTASSSVWGIEQIDDVSGDGVKDIIAGDFSGHIYGLSATNGAQQYTNSIGTCLIVGSIKLNDVNSDGHPDIVFRHSTIHTTQVINGQTGSIIWSHPVADQPWNAARISDVSGDTIDDLIIGTLYTSNYCYFLDGTDGSELSVIGYGEAVDAINAIPDVVADGSMEMVAGGRNGKLTCISGGLDAGGENNPPEAPIIDGPTIGATEIKYDFTFVTTDSDDDDVYYYIDWGDGNYEDWIGPFGSGEEIIVNHSWLSENTYTILSKAKDIHDAESSWSEPFNITIVENEPPIPPTINGTVEGKPSVSLEYAFFSTDPDGNELYYYVDWGDGMDDTIGPFPSGTEEKLSHSWASGNYVIKAKAMDIYGAESDWTTLEISIPRSRFTLNMLTKILFERFSIISYILEILLNI